MQCVMALEIFRAVAIFFVFFSEASAIQIGVGRCWLLSKFSFFVCQFNVSTVAIGFPVTVCRFAMGGIFTNNFYAEHKTFGYL